MVTVVPHDACSQLTETMARTSNSLKMCARAVDSTSRSTFAFLISTSFSSSAQKKSDVTSTSPPPSLPPPPPSLSAAAPSPPPPCQQQRAGTPSRFDVEAATACTPHIGTVAVAGGSALGLLP